MNDYSRAWRSHRFWRRLPLLAFAAAALLLVAMGQFAVLRGLQPWLPVVWVVMVLCFVMANIRMASFRCPRCRRRFHGGLLGRSPGSGRFAFREDAGKSCGHCGLALYADR